MILKSIEKILTELSVRVFLLSNMFAQILGIFLWELHQLVGYLIISPMVGFVFGSFFKISIYGSKEKKISLYILSLKNETESLKIIALIFSVILYYLFQNFIFLFIGPLCAIIINIQYVIYGENISISLVVQQSIALFLVIMAPLIPFMLMFVYIILVIINFKKLIHIVSFFKVYRDMLTRSLNLLWVIPVFLPAIEMNNRAILLYEDQTNLVQWTYQYSFFLLVFGSFVRSIRQKILLNIKNFATIIYSFFISVSLLTICYFSLDYLSIFEENLVYLYQINKITLIMILFCSLNYLIGLCIDYFRAKNIQIGNGILLSIIFSATSFECLRFFGYVPFYSIPIFLAVVILLLVNKFRIQNE